MDYKYDIFLSYPNVDPIIRDWVREIFLPLFTTFLGGSMDLTPKIFYDKRDIEPGDSWRKELVDGLIYSKCLVGIWCPEYFRRGWCRSECAVMLHRQKELGKVLVVPVKIFDGKYFPKEAKAIQYLDLYSFFRTAEGFKKTETYHELQNIMKNWIEEKLVKKLEEAPEWEERFKSKEWTKNLIDNIGDLPTINSSAPLLQGI